MSNEFLEEVLSVDIQYGSSYQDDYSVEITETSGNSSTPALEYRRLLHPYPTRYFTISYLKTNEETYTKVVNIYHRAFGKFAGFRAKAIDDFSTNGLIGAPTALDQILDLVSTGIYQLIKKYGTDNSSISIGYPKRTIFKPVSGTVLISINSIIVPITQMWTVDLTTGKVTFVANKTKAITGISKAASAVISFATAHSYILGESVHISSVVGMTQINNLRGVVTNVNSNDISINIDSTGFSTYTSGGNTNTRPQAGEIVRGGCEFDIPVRFDSSIPIKQEYYDHRVLDNIQLKELLSL